MGRNFTDEQKEEIKDWSYISEKDWLYISENLTNEEMREFVEELQNITEEETKNLTLRRSLIRESNINEILGKNKHSDKELFEKL